MKEKLDTKLRKKLKQNETMEKLFPVVFWRKRVEGWCFLPYLPSFLLFMIKCSFENIVKVRDFQGKINLPSTCQILEQIFDS